MPCAHRLQSSLPLHAACAVAAPPTSPPPGPHPAPHRVLSFRTRQRAKVFNQPLSFDTSRVTDMRSMLRVHFARVSCAHRLQSSPPLHATCAATAPPTILPAFQAAPRSPASYGPLLTRQEAKAFNQPLNFDTSRVTEMGEMLKVHPVCTLRPDSSRAFLCTLHARPPPHRRPPASYASFQLGSKRRSSTSR